MTTIRSIGCVVVLCGLGLAGCKSDDDSPDFSDLAAKPPLASVGYRGKIHGVVAVGAPVDGAQVSGRDASGNVFGAVTDSAGEFFFDLANKTVSWPVTLCAKLPGGKSLCGGTTGDDKKLATQGVEMNINPATDLMARATCARGGQPFTQKNDNWTCGSDFPGAGLVDAFKATLVKVREGVATGLDFALGVVTGNYDDFDKRYIADPGLDKADTLFAFTRFELSGDTLTVTDIAGKPLTSMTIALER